MKWLLIGGGIVAVYYIMRSRATAGFPEAMPAPPVPGPITAPMPVTVKTPEGEAWEATMGGTYILTR